MAGPKFVVYDCVLVVKPGMCTQVSLPSPDCPQLTSSQQLPATRASTGPDPLLDTRRKRSRIWTSTTAGTWQVNMRKASKLPPPRHRLRDRRAYWGATMRQMGLVCALTLSVITDNFRMDWDLERGLAAPTFLRNHHSALAEAAFVAESIAAGIAARTMLACSRDELICILPLGMAFDSAMKRRLIWDGRSSTATCGSVPSAWRPSNGRVAHSSRLFERSSHGGTLNISSAYHHLDMAQVAFPYLGFE